MTSLLYAWPTLDLTRAVHRALFPQRTQGLLFPVLLCSILPQKATERRALICRRLGVFSTLHCGTSDRRVLPTLHYEACFFQPCTMRPSGCQTCYQKDWVSFKFDVGSSARKHVFWRNELTLHDSSKHMPLSSQDAIFIAIVT